MAVVGGDGIKREPVKSKEETAEAIHTALYELKHGLPPSDPTAQREIARAWRSADSNQIADLILTEGMRISSPLKSTTGFGTDIEHRFEISDGNSRVGVIIVLTELKPLSLVKAAPDGGK